MTCQYEYQNQKNLSAVSHAKKITKYEGDHADCLKEWRI